MMKRIHTVLELKVDFTIGGGIMQSSNREMLRCFIYPESVAVIGASSNQEKIGFTIVKNLLNYGYRGKLYLVNPKETNILGFDVYHDIKSIKEDVDLVFIVTPAKIVPSIIEDCAERNVKGAIIVSSGFGEMGSEGKKIERDMVEKSRKSGMRILGPNSIGVISPKSRIPWALPLLPHHLYDEGDVAFISQSGGVTTTFSLMAGERNLKFKAVVHIGNESDLGVEDWIEYFGEEKGVRVIAVFIEGVKNGRRFMKVLKNVTPHKPICILKGGKTEEGSAAVLTHTGAISGSDDIYNAVFKQTGAIRADNIEELIDFVECFDRLSLPEGDRVIILTGSGGIGVLTADACVESGLKLPPIPEDIEKELENVLPQYWNGKRNILNPLDMTVGGSWGGVVKRYSTCMEIISNSKDVDIMIVCSSVAGNQIAKKFTRELINVRKKINKPFVLVWPPSGNGSLIEFKRELRNNGIVVFSDPYRAARSISCLVKYKKFLERN